MKHQSSGQYANQARLHRTALYIMGVFILLLAVCRIDAKTSNSLSGSILQYGVSYSADAPLPESKPADSNSLRLEGPLDITVTFVPMKGYPENTLDPIESQTQMITVLPSSSAVTAVAGLLRKARVGVILNETQFPKPAAREKAALFPSQTLHGVLPDGVNACFRVVNRPIMNVDAARKLEIHVKRKLVQEPNSVPLSPTDIALEISLVATGLVTETTVPYGGSSAISPTEEQEQGRSRPAASRMLTTETIVLSTQIVQEQDRLGLILPSSFEMEGVTVFAVQIVVKAPPQEGTPEAVTYAAQLKECQDSLQTSGKQEAPQFDAGRRGVEDAFGLLLWPTHRRQALLYLAAEVKAPLIEDIALSGRDTVIDRLANAILDACETGPCFEANTLGWRLQQITYQVIADTIFTDKLRPAIESIAIRYTGEVGRHPSVLKEMVSDANSVTDLNQRLLLENAIYLEDISPAARTRAFEWLTAKGKAPQGYDPLATLKERRAALNRSQQAQQ